MGGLGRGGCAAAGGFPVGGGASWWSEEPGRGSGAEILFAGAGVSASCTCLAGFAYIGGRDCGVCGLYGVRMGVCGVGLRRAGVVVLETGLGTFDCRAGLVAFRAALCCWRSRCGAKTGARSWMTVWRNSSIVARCCSNSTSSPSPIVAPGLRYLSVCRNREARKLGFLPFPSFLASSSSSSFSISLARSTYDKCPALVIEKHAVVESVEAHRPWGRSSSVREHRRQSQRETNRRAISSASAFFAAQCHSGRSVVKSKSRRERGNLGPHNAVLPDRGSL